MKTTIDSNVWNALRANTEKGIRFYLHGVYIDPENKSAVATDGHALLRVDITIDGDICNPFIVDLTGHAKAPKGGTVEIDTSDLNGMGSIVYKTKNGTQKAAMALLKIDGTFPDYKRVIPDREQCNETFDQVTFNPELVSRTTREMGVIGVHFTSEETSGKGALRVVMRDHEQHDFIVMPMRR